MARAQSRLWVSPGVAISVAGASRPQETDLPALSTLGLWLFFKPQRVISGDLQAPLHVVTRNRAASKSPRGGSRGCCATRGGLCGSPVSPEGTSSAWAPLCQSVRMPVSTYRQRKGIDFGSDRPVLGFWSGILDPPLISRMMWGQMAASQTSVQSPVSGFASTPLPGVPHKNLRISPWAWRALL